MNPSNQLAVNSYRFGVTNLNLYFFSWIAFFISFMNFFACTSMSISSFIEVMNESSNNRRCGRASWAGIMVTSFIVMIAASRIFQDVQCDQSTGDIALFDEVCDRTKFGVALGSISTIVAAIWLIVTMFWLKGSMGTMIELGLVLFLMAMWTVGVALLTFDEEKSPGSGLGNLYVFTWSSWSINVFMTMTSIQNFMNRSESTDTANQNEGDGKAAMDDAPVAMEQGTSGDEVAA